MLSTYIMNLFSPSLQTPNRYLDSRKPIGQFIRAMIRTIVALIGLGVLVALIQPVANRITALLLALACLLLGAFVGFLFGIPRVLQADGGPGTPTPPATNSPTALTNYRQEVNTNLEQISDWLTKIIVGLGLVNLYKIPDLLRDTSELIAEGMASPKDISSATVFANALILYFPVLGFLVGYLITRIFLSGVFRLTDTQGLMDNPQDIGLNAGEEITLSDVVKSLFKVVSANLATPDPVPTSAAQANAVPTLLPKRILWVDDKPVNNVIERGTLGKAGIDVVAVESTVDALSELTKSAFDLVISDMGRIENGTFNATAGIDLIKQLKTGSFPNLRMILYTSKEGFDQYNTQARQAGADDVVYSPRILMKSIGLIETA